MRPGPLNPSPGAPECGNSTPAAVAELESLRNQLAVQKDANLSLAADFENFKRRSRQETDLRAAAQKDSFVLELLPAIDNLERALLAGPTTGAVELHKGVEMTYQQLRRLLAQHGIEAEESLGQIFDPHRHEAVSQRHDQAHADKVIVEVLQRGYRRGDKVFRPAKVVVNKGLLSKHNSHSR